MRNIVRIIGLLSAAVCIVASCNKKIIDPEPPYTDKEDQENTQNPEPPDHVDPEDASVSFVISLPDNMTENNNDAAQINEFHYEVYSFDPQNICYVLNPEATPVIKDTLVFTDGMTLEFGFAGTDKKEHVLVAWAQAACTEGNAHYDLSDLRCVRCAEGQQPLSNDVSRAAYYITHKFTTEGPEYSEEITLSRPHARINLGTFAEALRRPDGTTLRLEQSSVSLKGISSEFNTITGLGEASVEFYGKAGSPTADSYEFTLNDIPAENIIINEKGYPYLALNYFFTAGSVDMEFVVTGTPYRLVEGETEGEMVEKTSDPVTFEGKLTGINARQDWVTNIVGYFFGADGRFEYDFRLGVEESDNSIIIGDEDGDGYYDEPMDFSWGDALGGDDTPSGGGIGGGGDDFVGPGTGDNDDIIPDDPEKEKQNNRIETPDAVTWEVYTANGLLMWAEEVRNSTTKQRINLKLFDDIYLKDEWVPVRTAAEDNYYGSIDGQGYAIYNLTINDSEGYNIGFLSRMTQTDKIQVANLNFYDVSIVGGTRVGTIVGTGEALYNCTVHSGSVQGNEMVGGVMGCVIGHKDRAPRQCTNHASVSGNTMVGGIAGDENSGVYVYIYDCINYGEVTATGDYVGGICSGRSNLYPDGCENHGNVSGNNYVGGIKGKNIGNQLPSECINYGNVTGNTYVGGITGNGSMSDCINNGNVSGVQYVGGLIGYYNTAGLNKGFNYGDIKGESYVGGCAGYVSTNTMYLKLSSLNNSGKVEGVTNVGGIAGYARCNHGQEKSSISLCINEGDVTGEENIGGLIGQLNNYFASSSMTLTNNSTSGIVTGKTNVGQLYGLGSGNGSGAITDDGTNVCTGEVVIGQ